MDWRFLVPGGPRLGRVVLVGGDRSLDAALRDVASAVVEAGSDAAADVVVAADPTTSDLLAAIETVERGAVLVIEHARRNDLGRTLPANGLGRLGAYVSWPGSTLPRAHLPIDDGAARRRFLLDSVRGGPPIRRLAGLGRVVAFEARLATGRGPRRVEVWTRDGAESAPSDGVAHRGAGRSGPDELLARVSTPDVDLEPAPFTWSLLTPGGRTVSKVVALGGPRGQRPRVVVKSPRTSAAALGLRHEATVLAALAQAHPAMLGSTPRLLGLVDHPDGPSLVETYLHGARLTRVLTARTFERLSDLVVASLLQLVGPGDIEGADASSGDPIVTPDPAGPTGSLDEIIERFRIGVAGRADPVLLEESMALARGLSYLPVATEHRDPGPWNLLVGGDGQVLVLDWESSVLNGRAGPDAWYALTYLALACGRVPETRLADAYPELLAPARTIGRVADRAFGHYADAAGIGRADLPAIRMLTWMIHLPSETGRADEDRAAELDGGDDALDDALQIPVARSSAAFLRLWEHDARAALGAH